MKALAPRCRLIETNFRNTIFGGSAHPVRRYASGFIGLQSEIDGAKRNKVVKPTKFLDEPILNPQIQQKKINNGILNNFSFSGLFSLTA